jgi:hypothetical protein
LKQKETILKLGNALKSKSKIGLGASTSTLYQGFTRGGRRENFGVFHVKNHDFTQKNLIFSICRGRRETFWGISCEKS